MLRRIKYSGILMIGMALLFMAVCIHSGPLHASEPSHFPDYYPKKFDGVGRIDRIGEEEIVIDDSSYRLSPYTHYGTFRSPNAFKHAFKIGNLVGFTMDSQRQIGSLWMIK